MVLQTNAVVDPRTVMVHHVNTRLTYAAVMGTRRFNRLALITFLGPELLKLSRSLCSIAQKCFDFLGEAFESLVF